MEEGFMIPNDPLFPLQWYLNNTGQFGGTPGVDIDVLKVWDDYNGAGVTVGVYDDGVDTVPPDAHPDLVANWDSALQPTTNGSVNGQPVTLDDNHGTPVAGIIAASTNNGVGIAGIAFGATFGTVKILNNPDTAPSEADLLGTLTGFDITNHSWWFPDNAFTSNNVAPFEAAATSGRVVDGTSLGTIIVKIAGNGRAIVQDANNDIISTGR